MTLRVSSSVFSIFGLMMTLGCAGELSADVPLPRDGGGDAGAPDIAIVMSCDRAAPLLAACLACHSRATAAANGGFDMESAGWETKLVGKSTPADAPDSSLCKGRNLPFLEEKTLPARGLFLDKLRLSAPPCGAQMPKALPKLNAADTECLRAWANGVVSAASR